MEVVMQVSKSQPPIDHKAGFPGAAGERRRRVRRAIEADAETLRRLAR